MTILPASPRLAAWPLFLRFLRIGAAAFGGPVAQIARLKQEFVDDGRWITQEQFRRVLAVYQVLPGPEATELCVYFGMHARGRLGGLLAGLGFVLPGFVLMLLLSLAYTSLGAWTPATLALFAGMQAAVVALVVRATQRIARHALVDRPLLVLAVASCLSQLLGAHFAIALSACGLGYVAMRRGWRSAMTAIALVWVAVIVFTVMRTGLAAELLDPHAIAGPAPGVLALLGSGLGAGLLTFGGAYTVIPFLQDDAVGPAGWMTAQQFLDGVALSGVLPAPLVIFGTFVGWIGGGLLGALAMTVGIFAPAFGFTLLGHELFERLVQRPGLHRFLDGVTAGVVGLVAATALQMIPVALHSPSRVVIGVVALAVLFRWTNRSAVPCVVAGAALAGWILC